LQDICPGWPKTLILLISASWVARITGMSPAYFPLERNQFHDREIGYRQSILTQLQLVCLSFVLTARAQLFQRFQQKACGFYLCPLILGVALTSDFDFPAFCACQSILNIHISLT
jgi:hypothetical protein